MPDTQAKMRLTDAQMEQIHAAIVADNNPIVVALRETFNFLLAPEGKAWDSFSEDSKLKPMDYAIPESQWTQIATWLQEQGYKYGGGDANVHLALEWMNIGPSSYKHLTDAQERTLRNLCERYGVEFREEHYHVYPPDSFMMARYAEGWVGGPTHANPQYAEPTEPRGAPTIFVGVSPEGDSHS